VTPVRLTIVTIPPAPVCGRLTGIRSRAAAMSGSRAALLHPPHVTLRTGALVPERQIKDFERELRAAAGPWRPFPLHARGLFRTTYTSGEGAERHMVAWRILPDPPLLDLHGKLLACSRFQRRPQPPFDPHLTLAYEDLTGEAADTLLAYAQDHPDEFPPELSWPCTNVTLCRRAGERWEPCVILHTIEEQL
jgi:2'-5' RNA ligase